MFAGSCLTTRVVASPPPMESIVGKLVSSPACGRVGAVCRSGARAVVLGCAVPLLPEYVSRKLRGDELTSYVWHVAIVLFLRVVELASLVRALSLCLISVVRVRDFVFFSSDSATILKYRVCLC